MAINRTDVTRRGVLGSGVILIAGCTASDPDDQADDERGLDLDGASDDGGDDADSGDDETRDDETMADWPKYGENRPELDQIYPTYHGTFIDSGEPTDVFEDIQEWSASGDITSDTDYHFTTSQSLAYEGESGSIFREFQREPLDLSGKDLSLAGYFQHDVDSVSSFYVIAEAPDQANRIVWRARYFPTTGWERFDLTPVATDGDPDRSDIRKLELDGEHPYGDTTVFNVDDLRLHPRPERGKIVLLFEDCRRIHYDEYRHVLAEYDYPATEAVHQELVRSSHSGRMSNWQVQALYDDGWEVCATTPDSPWQLSEEVFREEIRDQLDWFDTYDFERGTNTFMYPYGAPDTHHLEVLGTHFDLAFTGKGRCTNYSLTNPLTLPKFDTTNGIGETKEVIDRAAEYRSVGVLRFKDDYNRSEFSEIIGHIAAAGDDLDVIAPSELAAYAWEAGT